MKNGRNQREMCFPLNQNQATKTFQKASVWVKLLGEKSPSSSKSPLFHPKHVVAAEDLPWLLDVLKKAPSSRSPLSGKMTEPKILFRRGSQEEILPDEIPDIAVQTQVAPIFWIIAGIWSWAWSRCQMCCAGLGKGVQGFPWGSFLPEQYVLVHALYSTRPR